MLPRLINTDRPVHRTGPRISRAKFSSSDARIALQQLGVGQCTPCVAGVQICCELSGWPIPSLKCGPRPC